MHPAILVFEIVTGEVRVSYISPAILLPLHPAYLTNKNPQRLIINHGMCPVGRKD